MRANGPEQFWERVNRQSPDQCWEWAGARDKDGYGLVRINGRKMRAHRYALELSEGRILGPGECALHSCDNPPCCNPTHLFPGNNAENVADMVSKSRHPKAEGNGRARLTWAEVRGIRALYDCGLFIQSELGSLYGVSQRMISNIVRHENWETID